MKLRHATASLFFSLTGLAAPGANGQLRSADTLEVVSVDLVRSPAQSGRVGVTAPVALPSPEILKPSVSCQGQTVLFSVPLRARSEGSRTGRIALRIDPWSRDSNPASQRTPKGWRGEIQSVPQLDPGQPLHVAKWSVALPVVATRNLVQVTTDFGSSSKETHWELPVRCAAAPPQDSWVVRKTVSQAFVQELERLSPEEANRLGCTDIEGRAGAWGGRLSSVNSIFSEFYCSYRWEGKGRPQTALLTDLQPSGSVRALRAELDPPLLVPLASDPAGASEPPWADRIHAQIKRVREHLALDSILPRHEGGPVRLAILDSAAHDFHSRNLDTSPHGRFVGLLAQEVACAGLTSGAGDCPVEFVNALALPIVSTGGDATRREEIHGGYLGSRLDVAHAIRRVVDSWWEDVEAEGWFPLVMNLSLGWHGRHECEKFGCGVPVDENLASLPSVPSRFDLPGDEPNGRTLWPTSPKPLSVVASSQPASEAVYAELLRAHCLGALAFAAAGNAAGGDRWGPLLPAAWAATAGDPHSFCRVFEGQVRRAGRKLPDTESPLVYAVGALGFDGDASPTNRIGAMPELAALGVGVATRQSDPQRALRVSPTSGTSMSTAIVAGATAALWSLHRGQTNGRQVVLDLHDSAHRGFAATTMVLSSTSGAYRAAPLTGGTGEVDACTPLLAAHLPCRPARASGPPRLPLSPAPNAEFSLEISEAPWVFPQPWDISCPSCSLEPDSDSASKVIALVGHDIPALQAPLEMSATAGSDVYSLTPYSILDPGLAAAVAPSPLFDWHGVDERILVDTNDSAATGLTAATLRVETHAEGSSTVPLWGEFPLVQ